jgi:hypothetical protein
MINVAERWNKTKQVGKMPELKLAGTYLPVILYKLYNLNIL